MPFHLQNYEPAFVNSRPTGWPYATVEETPQLGLSEGRWQLRMLRQGVIVLWEEGKPFPRKFGRGTVVAASDDRKKLERAMVTFCQSLRGYFPDDFISTPYSDFVMGLNWTTGTSVQYGMAHQIFAAFLTGTDEGYHQGWDIGRAFEAKAQQDYSDFCSEKYATTTR